MKKPVVDSTQKKVKEIEFGVFSPQDASKLAILRVASQNLYDISQPGRPVMKDGVLDKRLGCGSKGDLCETCGEQINECVGHFGVIMLNRPVFHIGYFKPLINVLQNICKTCATVLLDETKRRSFLNRLRNPNLDGIQRQEILKSLNALCKKTGVCPHCGATNGSIKKMGALKLIHEKYKKKPRKDAVEEAHNFYSSFSSAAKHTPEIKPHLKKAQEDLNPRTVLELLKRISNEDCELMGLNSHVGRPERFILEHIAVPPLCIRPSIGQENASTEDDITVLMSEIVETNAKIRKIEIDGETPQQLMDHWDYLQLQCAMYITSELPGIPSTLQANIQKIKKGFCQRLKGKHGRFRGNLSGKRVDFSGRTVISPDPNLRIDQVAVPERMAKILTYPERVNQFNIQVLRAAVRNGPDVHPGACYIEKGDGSDNKKFLKYGNRNEAADQLSNGDVVLRHLRDDDIVLFNRQPSLHKLSIMCHYAKVLPWRTLRFNECVCTPYNADFDGDEMNLHLPQTEEARAEAAQLMATKHNLVTPRNGQPLIAANQDFITAGYFTSQRNAFFTRAEFCQMCMFFTNGYVHLDLPPPAIIKPRPLWSGKQIWSMLLRPNKETKVFVNLETKCRNHEKPKQKMKNGGDFHLSMDPSDNYLVIHNSDLMCGTVDKAIIGAESKRGIFYVLLRDYGPDIAAEAMNRVAKLGARFLGNRGFSIGIDDVQASEALLKERARVVEFRYKNCDDFTEQYNKGTLELVSGMNAEQSLESKIRDELNIIRQEVGKKCLDTLPKYNAPVTMSACGSKGSSLNVSQMVACVGQQDISRKRIPDGFGDRSLPHFPHKSKTPAAKGFVANSFYTGLDPSEFLFHGAAGREGLVDTAVKTAETGYMQRRLMKALEDLTVHYDDTVRNSSAGVVQFKYGDDALDPVDIEAEDQPVEFTRNLAHTLAVVPGYDERRLLPFQITQMLEDFMAQMSEKVSGQFKESLRKFFKTHIVVPLSELRAAAGLPPFLEEKVAPGETFVDEGDGIRKLQQRFTPFQIRHFLKICSDKYDRAQIEPGTAVGAVGAQSIGEPGTQMTLKTFHFAGIASANVTLGVPRIKEIINASKAISGPIISTMLIPGTTEIAARFAKARIEKTTLREVAMYFEQAVEGDTYVVNVMIDMNLVAKLKLEITLESIAKAISAAPKLKLSSALINVDTMHNIIRVVVPEGSSKSASVVDPYLRLRTLSRQLPNVVIEGLPTVGRAIIAPHPKTKDLYLLVEGTGLSQVMGTLGVDGLRTTSNNILEVRKVLGIEAARTTIINEIIFVMENYGITIDRRHLMLLADLMTFKGDVLGITRFGIAKMKDSVLMLASFEKTTDHLFEASFFNKKDTVDGVSECIIMGVPMGIGTGLHKIIHKTEGPDAEVPYKPVFESAYAEAKKVKAKLDHS
ncbi:DNA-directed RNA polymerase [Synchytrium endobioticum]|uniref:DNA-directed RNA polymerase subunit n=1 Tax=Synchytrium endobioticum TaxID=286115 RepID=A0A507DBF3_9FUNG|nr:DNA-directed RNA polymerase [Synchytrium endobioticum]TPX53600.1 DNA-directed RNA polymerase [Synchytrium endobioticum]